MKRLGSSVLLEYEWDALKDALKRDIDREMKMAQVDTDFVHWHLYNARMAQRLLNVMRGEERESKAGDKPSRSDIAAPRNSTSMHPAGSEPRESGHPEMDTLHA